MLEVRERQLLRRMRIMSVQVDEDTGRVSYLGTGIACERAAKRYLKRKFNQGAPRLPVSRPGARFYVTAILGRNASYWVMGPYASDHIALAKVSEARRRLSSGPLFWASLGTSSDAGPSRVTEFGR